MIRMHLPTRNTKHRTRTNTQKRIQKTLKHKRPNADAMCYDASKTQARTTQTHAKRTQPHIPRTTQNAITAVKPQNAIKTHNDQNANGTQTQNASSTQTQ